MIGLPLYEKNVEKKFELPSMLSVNKTVRNFKGSRQLTDNTIINAMVYVLTSPERLYVPRYHSSADIPTIDQGVTGFYSR